MSAFNTGALNPLPSSGASPEKRVYEPSMEEILASIRRIIADDQSLPGRVTMERDEPPPELRQAPSAPEPVEPHDDPRVETSWTAHDAPANHKPTAAPLTQAVRSAAPEEPVVSSPAQPQAVRPQAVQPTHGTIFAPQYPMPDRDHVEQEIAQADPAASPPPMAATDDPSVTGDAPPSHSAAVTEAVSAVDDGLFDQPIEPAPHASKDAPPTLFSAATDSSVSAAFNMLAASRLADNSDELMNMVREMIRPLLRNWLDDNLPSMVERMVRAEIERVARGGR